MKLLGVYKVSFSDHAIKQYSDRAQFKGEVIRNIKRDLRPLNIKQIVYTDESIYVFTKNYKEFIFARKKKDSLCLVTFIKRNKDDTIITIEKRKKLVHS